MLSSQNSKEDKTMKKSTEIIPVTVFTIPAPVRGFSWAIRTTWRAAKRFWEDTEEVRWFAWEGMKRAGRLGLNVFCHLWHLAEDAVHTLGRILPIIWRKAKETLPVLWGEARVGFALLCGCVEEYAKGLVLFLAFNLAGGMFTLTLLMEKGIEASRKAVRNITANLVSAWRFREELIEEWA